MGLLNRIGIGSATVDTILESETVRPGESVEAHVEIEGGDDDQEVAELELAVATEYQVPSDDDFYYETAELHEMELTDGFTIEAGESRTMDVPPIEIPVETPATISQTSVWIQTGLEIDWSADPTDEDQLTVEPGPYLEATLAAMENLGLELEFADNAKSRFGPGAFAQFFEFENRGAAAWSDLDDVECHVAPAEDHLTIQMTVESTAMGLLGGDESRTEVTVDSTDPATVERTIREAIDRHLD